MPPLGIGVGGPLADVAWSAQQAEALGLESVWVTELTRSAFISAAAAIAATNRVTVGTGVALAFPRSPTITAMEAWDLDELSGERFELGLGTQVKRVLEARFSVPFEAPAAKLAEYARAVRAVWAANRGEGVTHDGRFYRISMPTFHGPAQSGRRDVPILFAAVGEGLCRVAGAVADGVVGHPFASPRYLRDVVAPAIEAGAVAAGRSADACPLNPAVIVSVGDDVDQARRAARLQIAFYATTRTYTGILETHDRAGIQHDLRRAFVRRDHVRMADLIDDELLDAIAAAGRVDEAADRLSAWADLPHVRRIVLTPPWYAVDEGRSRELTAGALSVAAAAAGRGARAAGNPAPAARSAGEPRG